MKIEQTNNNVGAVNNFRVQDDFHLLTVLHQMVTRHLPSKPAGEYYSNEEVEAALIKALAAAFGTAVEKKIQLGTSCAPAGNGKAWKSK